MAAPLLFLPGGGELGEVLTMQVTYAASIVTTFSFRIALISRIGG
jgi:hypothetical protein